jgi:hypothetical protein
MPRILLMLLLVGTLGCSATVPLVSPELDQATKQFASLGEGAEIYLMRLQTYTGRMVLVHCTLDGRMLGGIAAGTYLRVPVPPGMHMLGAFTTDNQVNLPVTVLAGQRAYVDVRIGVLLNAGRVALQPLDEEAGRAGVLATVQAAGM